MPAHESERAEVLERIAEAQRATKDRRIGRLRWSWSLVFEPRDLWIGVYWDCGVDTFGRAWLSVYLCPLPTVVLRLKRAPWSWYGGRSSAQR